MPARVLTAAALVCLLAGCSGPSAPKKDSASPKEQRPDTATPPDEDKSTREKERRRRIREYEQREKAAQKRAEQFLYRLGLTGMPRARVVRSRFLALTPEDQDKALHTAEVIRTDGRSEVLKKDSLRKEADFLRAHPDLFPES